MDPIDMQELIVRGPQNKLEALRVELYQKINQLGIGAQGLGGLTTVLDIKIKDYPTHAANLPIAMIPNCAATRHAHFHLDGSGPVALAGRRRCGASAIWAQLRRGAICWVRNATRKRSMPRKACAGSATGSTR